MSTDATTDRNPLRRLRILQILALADGEELPASAILTLLKGDPDLDPDAHVVLRSLIWLEDNGLADVRVVDDTNTATFASITQGGLAYLDRSGAAIGGIAHPADFMRETG